ncbi:MAG: TolC family protein [candidate division FCPU426 bacterium]
MTKKVLALAVLLIGAGGSPVLAATDAAGNTAGAVLSFERARDLAQEYSKTYQQELAKERQAQSRWWQALLALGPTGTLQAGYILKNKPSTMTIDTSAFMPPGSPAATQELELSSNYTSGRVMLSQPLFTGGKLYSGLEMAGLQAESARDSVRLAGTQLYVDAVEAYYQVVLNQRSLQVMESSLASLEQHLAVVKARYREGLASNFEVLRSQVQVANLKPSVLRMRTALALSKNALAMLTGLPLGSPLEVDDRLEVAAESWATLPELLARAQERRLELKNLERSQRLAGIGVRLAATGNVPNVALTGTWNYYDTEDRGFPPAGENLKHSWDVSLGLSWTFWDNLSALPRALEAEAKVQEAELGRQALVDGIQQQVEAAYLTLTAAQETYQAQQQAVDLARDSYRLAEVQYANGQVTNLEVLDARVALNQAELTALETLYQYRLAGVKLHQAVGDTF